MHEIDLFGTKVSNKSATVNICSFATGEKDFRLEKGCIAMNIWKGHTLPGSSVQL